MTASSDTRHPSVPEAAVLSAIDGEIARMAPFLGANDRGFLGRVFAKGLDAYGRRLRCHGFAGLGDVLDAGCGFGQWSLALTLLGNRVSAVDQAAERLMFLDAVRGRLDLRDLAVRRAALSELPFADESFDGLFCYSTLFLTDWRAVVPELLRVLRVGGRIYLNANGFGWYKQLWMTGHNRTEDYDPMLVAARALENTWRDRRGLPLASGDVIIEPEDLLAALRAGGCDDMACGPEGTVAADPGAPASQSFFQGDYGGDLGVFEILATKARRGTSAGS